MATNITNPKQHGSSDSKNLTPQIAGDSSSNNFNSLEELATTSKNQQQDENGDNFSSPRSSPSKSRTKQQQNAAQTDVTATQGRGSTQSTSSKHELKDGLTTAQQETARKILTDDQADKQHAYDQMDVTVLLDAQPIPELVNCLREISVQRFTPELSTEFDKLEKKKQVREVMKSLLFAGALPPVNARLLAVQFNLMNQSALKYVDQLLKSMIWSVCGLLNKNSRLTAELKHLENQAMETELFGSSNGTERAKAKALEERLLNIGRQNVQQASAPPKSMARADDEIVNLMSFSNALGTHSSKREKAVTFKSNPDHRSNSCSSAGTSSDDDDDYKILSATTPTYSGSASEDLEGWIFAINQAFMVCRCRTNKLKFGQLSNFVKGSAHMLLRNYLQTQPNPKIDQFYDLLRKSAPAETRNENLKLKLLDLRQGENTNFAHFKDKFLNLLLQLKASGNHVGDELFLFKRACRPQLHFELNSRSPNTLEEAIAIASDYEQKVSSLRSNEKINFAASKDRNKKNKNFKPFKKLSQICSYCGKNNHSAENCRSRLQVLSKNKNNQYNNKLGNAANSSNNISTNNNNNYNNNNNNNNSFYKNKYTDNNNNNNSAFNNVKKTNFNNKKANYLATAAVGPLQANCNVVDSDPIVYNRAYMALSTDILCVNGYVDNVSATLVLDTGASRSLLSLKFATRHNFELLNSKKEVTSVDGSSVQVLGHTRDVPVTINHSTVNLKFIVINNDDLDGILGNDWFILTKASVTPYNKQVAIPKQINLEDESDSNVELAMFETVGSIEEDYVHEWSFSPVDSNKIKPVAELTNKQQRKFRKLCDLIKRCAAEDLSQLGTCNIAEFDMTLTSDVPVYQPLRRRSLVENQQIAEEINMMLEHGIIRVSKSPYTSQIHMVRKKDGKWRLTIDYRQLNSITVKRQWPMKSIPDILDKLAGSAIYSVIDCKSGYWQVNIQEDCRRYTAFSSAEGHFEFNKMPFGLKNAPAMFCYLMFVIFHDVPFCECYIDDIVVFSKNVEEHLDHIAVVLTRLEKAGLKINLDKCVWLSAQVRFLGFLVDLMGIHADPARTDAIANKPIPSNVTELQRFLGMVNYYRKFIQNFARIAKPLYDLLTKEMGWSWQEAQQFACKHLKELLLKAPILRQPDLTRVFILYTDASREALGCILSQRDDDNKEYVCGYYSKSLKGAEKNYTIQELECLAVVWGIKENRIYLYGTRFTVVTDHQSLVWLKRLKDPNTRLLRWMIFLQEYDFEIVYRKGANHANVDALSRDVQDVQVLHALTRPLKPESVEPYENEALMHYLKYRMHKSGRPEKQCRTIEFVSKFFELINDRVYIKLDDTLLLIPTPDERNKIIEQAHGQGHFQADATVNEVKKLHHWPSMRDDIRKFISQCERCQRSEPTKRLFHPAKALPVTNVLDRVHIDLVFGLPQTEEGFTGIFLAIDSLSKYPFALPLKSKAASEVAKCLLEFVCLFGPPKMILSDNGKEFKGVVDEFLKLTCVDHAVTASYYPQCNGLAERFNQTLSTMLRKMCEKAPQTWHHWLPFALMCYRAKKHTSTQYTPDFLMFGRERNPFINYEMQFDNDVLVRTNEINKLFSTIYPDAINSIKKRQDQQKQLQDNRNNVLEEKLPIGSVVAIRNEGVVKKLAPRFTNKCTVSQIDEFDNYILRDNRGNVLKEKFPLSQLKLLSSEQVVEDDIEEVGRILDHRTSSAGTEYLIKWRKRPHSENSWVLAKDVDAPAAVDKYWRSSSVQKKQQQPQNTSLPPEMQTTVTRPRGRPKTPSVAMISYLIYLLCFWLIIKMASASTIVDQFKYCQNPEDAPLLNSKLCHSYERLHYKPKVSQTIAVLKRVNYDVSGIGYECTMTKLIVNFYFSLFSSNSSWFGKHHEVFEKYVQLNAKECRTMLTTKKCNNVTMKCQGSSCMGEKFPTGKYSYFDVHTDYGFRCTTRQVKIISDHFNDALFGDANCSPNKLFCMMNRSIVVWNASIVNKCPYVLLNRLEMFALGNSTYGTAVDDIMFQVDTESYKADVKANRRRCDVYLMKTFDDYYIANTTKHVSFNNATNKTTIQYADSFNSLKVSKETITTTLKYDRSYLEEIDSNFSLYNVLNKISYTSCVRYAANAMYIAKLKNNSFSIFQSESIGNKIVIFSINNLLRVPLCADVNSISFYSDDHMPETCFQDVPCFFSVNDKFTRGYLTDDNILVDQSKTVDCSRVRRTLVAGGRVILYANNRVNVIHKPSMVDVNLQEGNANNALYPLLSEFARFSEDDFIAFNREIQDNKKHFFGNLVDKVSYYWGIFVNIIYVIIVAIISGVTYKFCALSGCGELVYALILLALRASRAKLTALATRVRQCRKTTQQAEPIAELQPLQQVWAAASESNTPVVNLK